MQAVLGFHSFFHGIVMHVIRCASLVAFGVILTVGNCSLFAQTSDTPGQVADKAFVAKVENPRFDAERGPIVGIDQAHHNFHTATGRYQPFASVLRADGYRITSVTTEFTSSSLEELDVLVIANALAARNQNNWSLPTPSAFTDGEIEAVADWVSQGGSLLLIVDHMPFPGAAAQLAATFDARFYNGFVFDEELKRGSFSFSSGVDSGNTLLEHAISNGMQPGAVIPEVRTFTGSCFTGSDAFTPILRLSSSCVSLEPQKAWEFNEDTPRREVGGYWQAATREFGQGRLAVFGEAAMFTAQTQPGARKMGLSHPQAPHNQQFLLNTLHWLSEDFSY